MSVFKRVESAAGVDHLSAWAADLGSLLWSHSLHEPMMALAGCLALAAHILVPCLFKSLKGYAL